MVKRAGILMMRTNNSDIWYDFVMVGPTRSRGRVCNGKYDG